MNLMLEDVILRRGRWSLSANGTFGKGIHLISGNVGAGKSTLALAIAGLLPAESGTILCEGLTSSMISFQFPEYHITGSTLNEECESWALDPHNLLRSANLEAKAYHDPLKLSRGELKRLHLACILAKKYDLLVLDEPFSSLDCAEKERICAEISRQSAGVTLIFTHEQSIFPRVDTIWEITNGSLHTLGSPPDALTRWSHAPHLMRQLIEKGKTPHNISPEDIMEASCRT
jgi:energy-coupling factor transport system ATP-binding protein